MNKKFTKLMAALALLVFMMPSLAGWGQKGNDDYSIVMKDSGGIGESTSISTVVNTSIAEGNTYVQSISSVTAVYFAATGNGWKLGSGSAAGTFTLGLSSTAQALTVSKVVVKAKNYSTDVTTLTVTLTKSDNSTVDKSFSSLGSDFTDYEFELSSATTIKSIKVNTNGSKKRAYVHNIDVITAGGSATCTVTYDCNGGETDCPSNLSDIEPGTSINLAAAPTKAHFNFNGWKTGETTYQAGASYTVNSSVTFTAQWEPDGTYFEGSICFSNQSSCTAINSTSVTGDDDLGNTWTITTAGTSSFTANSAYYQVGSGTSPASRITFTTTFDEEVNVTDFSAAFGGFNVTKATITINVNNTTVGTGSLNGGTDVTVTNTSAEHGTTLTVIVEPTAGGVKCYSISYAYETLPPPAVATPVISVDETFVGSTTAEITCATTGATIYYSYDNSTWTEYTAALTITETKTIYAKAVNGTDESAVASKTTTRTWYEPTVNIDATGITNTDVYVSTTAGSLAATVNYNSEAISGITVTWSGDNDLVATIDASTGAVTLVSVGTVNFTASFAGNDEYSSASATYQMTVTSSAPNVQPTDFDINLNNSLFGTSYTGTVSNITDANPVSGTSNNVTVTYAGAGNHYINNDQIRFYPNNKLTFDAPEGYIITKIVFTASSWGITVKVGNETINSSTKTW